MFTHLYVSLTKATRFILHLGKKGGKAVIMNVTSYKRYEIQQASYLVSCKMSTDVDITTEESLSNAQTNNNR